MAKAPKNKRPKAKATNKAKDRTSSVDKLLMMQQQAVSRYAKYASSVANRLSQGDLNLSNWVSDYSALWKDMVDAVDGMVKATLPNSK